MKLKTILCTSACAAALAACSALPNSGPSQYDIAYSAVGTNEPSTPPGVAKVGYVLVDIDERVVQNSVDIGPGSFFKSFNVSKGAAPEIFVGVGDILQLTIFESKSGGLFIPSDSGTRPGNYVSLPNQIVDRDGKIAVPYAGEISAAGRRIEDIQREVQDKLASRAIQPQVVVSIVEQNWSTVSVVGEVQGATKVRIRRGGDRVLDVIAQAGGIRHPGYEIYVTLQRGKKHATVFFNSLVEHPEENVYVAPGDTVYVHREPRRFLAFGSNGASASPGVITASNQINFDQEKVSLAEGVAKAGGLMDYRADPSQVFLYRVEPREILLAMHVDLSNFPSSQEFIPAIYRANFRDPSSYFFAQRFQLRMRDILYVSNADSVEIAKLLGFFGTVTSNVAGYAHDGGVANHGWTYLTKGKAPSF
jgi:polysaccharide biosynthesis/export protein